MVKKISMKELAKATGLSLSSVSRALDPRRAHQVKEATRSKVLQAAADADFSINLSARRLKIRRTETISIAAWHQDPENSSHEFHPLTIGTIPKLQYAARRYGYDLKLMFLNENLLLPPEFFDPNRTDGIIFVGYHGDDYKTLLETRHIPAVFMSNYIDIHRTDVNLVGIDRRPGYEQAVADTLRRGCRKIAWLSCYEVNPKRSILRELLEKKGLREPEFFEVKNYYTIRDLAPQLAQFDAVFCANDVMADWLMREFLYCKVRKLPLVTGYDRDPAFFDLPPERRFNTIGYAENNMPELAVQMLDSLIRSGEDDSRQSVVVSTQYFPSQIRNGEA